MTLEQMCVSLELARKLKTLGVKQSSLFYWSTGGIFSRLECLPILESNYSAFTSGELGDMLPDELVANTASGSNKKIWHWHTGAMWFSGYQCENGMYMPIGVETSEANSRARCLIALIEQGLVGVNDE